MARGFRASDSHSEVALSKDVGAVVDRYRKETGYVVNWEELAQMIVRYARTEESSLGQEINGKIEAIARGDTRIQHERLKTFVGDVIEAFQQGAKRGA